MISGKIILLLIIIANVYFLFINCKKNNNEEDEPKKKYNYKPFIVILVFMFIALIASNNIKFCDNIDDKLYDNEFMTDIKINNLENLSDIANNIPSVFIPYK